MPTGGGITIDTTDSELYVVHLTKVAASMVPLIGKAMEVNARKVKDHARLQVRSQFGHIPHLPLSIDYEIELNGLEWVYEVGYNHKAPGGQGVLGHIIEYGGSTGYKSPNAPQRNLAKGLAANIDDLMLGLNKAVDVAWA